MILKNINGLSISTKSIENIDDSNVQNGDTLKYNSTTTKWEASPNISNAISIRASASEHGIISPNGINTYNQGEDVKFTFIPDDNYILKSVFIDGLKTDVLDDTYTFTNIQKSHMIHVEFEEKKPSLSYTFTIHKNIASTSPETCVTYEGGIIASAAKAYQLVHDEWLCPSVVKDGEVNYFLYKPDLTKKATDETGMVSSGEDSNLTGTDGDVCVSIKPIWWKVENNTDTELKIKISDTSFDDAITANMFNGTVRKWLHIGMFHSTTQTCTSIYSTSVNPKTDVTNDDFRSSTEARGDTYNIMTYLTWSLWDILCVFTSGSLNTQVTIGKDYTNTSHSTATAVATSTMLTSNGYTSSTKDSDDASLMYLFVANPWGNVWDWVCGLKSNSGFIGVAIDQYHARGITIEADIPSNWTKFLASHIVGYIIDVQGVTEYPFLIKEGDGSSSTYFCDYASMIGSFSSYSYCAAVGGKWNDGDNAGAFVCHHYYSSSITGNRYGARLQVLDINTI